MQKCVIFTPPRISLGFLRHLAENNVLCPFARPGLSENSQSPGGVPKTQCDDIPDVFPLLAGADGTCEDRTNRALFPFFPLPCAPIIRAIPVA